MKPPFFSGLLITAELGEINRFDEDKQVVSYAGLDPTVRESADSRTEVSISKRGNSRLRWILTSDEKGGGGRESTKLQRERLGA